jgi:CHAT domain-containing protein
MPQELKEMKVIQTVDTQVTTLFSAKAKPAAALAHLRDHRFAYIVCHGILEPGTPVRGLRSGFTEGSVSFCSTLCASRLPDAEFAFLSACQTAELTESVADEVLHLVAAMQFCGFRGVVGTMWAMAIPDGRDLAGSFYGSLFSDGARAQGVRLF